MLPLALFASAAGLVILTNFSIAHEILYMTLCGVMDLPLCMTPVTLVTAGPSSSVP